MYLEMTMSERRGFFRWLRSGRGRGSGNPGGEVRIRVELYSDDPGWVFRVPSLGITGGAPTKDEALARMMEAIQFSLETPNDKTPRSSKATQLYVGAELRPPRTPVPA
jgi:predicted RNase H-like HicB family nuclease